MAEPWTIAIILTVYLFAGLVKGVIGLGLPTVSLALLTLILDLPTAIALILVPAFLTNVWQGGTGGYAFAIARRLGIFLLAASACAALGTLAFRFVNLQALSALLGLLLMTYAIVNLAGWRPMITGRPAAWIEAALGAVTGLLTGMTGSAVVPGVMYMQALGMPRAMFVQAMGILFALTTIAIGIGLERNNLLTLELGLISAAALLPAIIGMMIGQRIRRALSESLFRRVFFSALLLLGGYIVLNSFNRLL